jgi:glycyl-tRNA synthetase beta subunit
MKKAIEGKFYLEAITIQESIITDRLLNFVIRNNIKNISEEELHKPIAYLNKLIEHCKSYFEDVNLCNELNEFRKSRNNCIHAMVKSYPGNPTQKVSEFQKLARETSLSGKILTRKVDAWHTRMKKRQNI